MSLDAIRDALARQGLILRGGFHPGEGDGAPPETGTILLVGNAGPAMWQAFSPARPAGPDPPPAMPAAEGGAEAAQGRGGWTPRGMARHLSCCCGVVRTPSPCPPSSPVARRSTS